MPVSSQQFWRRRARLLQWGVNGAWWLDRWMRLALPLVILSAVVVLLGRENAWVVSVQWMWGIFLVGLLFCGIAAWLWGHSHFIGITEAYARLDAYHGLHNGLTSAVNGVMAWPRPQAGGISGGYRLRPLLTLVPLGLALGSLLLAFLLPLSAGEVRGEATAEPGSWREMEKWADELVEEEVIAEEEAEEIRTEVEAFREAPKEEWFGQRSLEASDSMRTGLQRSIAELGRDLEMAATSLGGLEALPSGEIRDEVVSEFNRALDQLAASPLRLDAGLAAQLANIDPSRLRSISAEQMAELRERLRQAAGT